MEEYSAQPTVLLNKATRTKVFRSIDQTVTVIPNRSDEVVNKESILEAVSPR